MLAHLAVGIFVVETGFDCGRESLKEIGRRMSLYTLLKHGYVLIFWI